jgi:hypothetical protein
LYQKIQGMGRGILGVTRTADRHAWAACDGKP